MAADIGAQDLGSFIVSYPGVLEIRRVIIKEPVALQKWNYVKDSLIPYQDRQSVEDLLSKREPKYAKAILRTLILWKVAQSKNATLTVLIKKFRELQLVNLAEELERKVNLIRDPQNPEHKKLRFGQHVDPDFMVTERSTDQIRAAILDEPVALDKWGYIKDDLVMDLVDQRELDGLGLRDQIKKSLDLWVNSDGEATFNRLLTVFVDHRLNSLRDKLVKDAVELRQVEPALPVTVPEPAPTGTRVDQRPAQPETICTICQINKPNHVLKCGHVLCEDCLNKIILGPPDGNKCPVCRALILNYSDINPLYI